MQAPYTPPQNQEVQTPSTEKSSAGQIIGAIIVIIVLALGALYFWGAELNQGTNEMPYIPGDGSDLPAQAGELWMPPSNNSDAATAIESDLEETSMSEFESQMNADLEAANSEL